MSVKSPPDTAKSEREIFADALACPDPNERRRLLDSECGSDTELREAVDALLEESQGLGNFMECPVVSDTRITLSDPSIEKRDAVGENLGDQIGPYTLVDLIGEGGGGSVYLAEQVTPMQRTVALKLLKLGMDTKSVIARFEAERQTLAMMEHPNIARVIDAGATKEGRPYFVMEYVPGEPLTEYCDDNNLTVEQRLAIFIKVCRAVEHAHQKGIIHRDLKPSNILVAEQDGGAVPKIIDFGVAKAIDPLSSGNAEFTLIETVIGTPAYMSPEQAERGPRDIDTRSDVYSLGVLLDELLTSSTPLGTQGVERAGLDHVLNVLREMSPVRPSAQLQAVPTAEHRTIEFDRATTMERLISKLRGDLDWVVMKCLERDRSRRFGSASDLARDLELYLEGAPVTARPPSAAYRLGKFVRRHRAVVGSTCILLLTLIGAAAVSMALAVRATRAEQDMRVAHRVQSELRVDAVRDRERALDSAAAAHLHQYVADITLSHHALADGHIAKALHLLDRHGLPMAGERDLRGFEWRYLAGECLGDLHESLPIRTGSIESLAFSPRADLLAIASREDLLVWSLRENETTLSIPGGASEVAFFPDGERLAVATRGGVDVYDLDSGTSIWSLRARGGAMALSPDGLSLATSDRRGVTIWDTVTWTRRQLLPGCSSPLAFSPDGDTIATGTRDGMTLWSLGEENDRVLLEESPVANRGPFPGRNSLSFSPDGQFVVIAQNTRPTHSGYAMGVWEVRSGKEVSMLPGGSGADGHAGIISGASFDAAGTLLATSSWDHSLSLWDFESRSVLRTLHGHRGEVWSVALSPDGELVASGSKNGEVKIWPTKPSSRTDSIKGKWTPLGFSADSTYLAAYNRAGTLSIFNLRTCEAVHSMNLSSSGSRFFGYPVSMSRDLRVLAEGRSDGTVRIRTLEDETETSFRVGRGRIEFLALSPSADTVVTRNSSSRDELVWWDVSDQSEPIARMAGTRALFSEDGKTLVTISRVGSAIVWDSASRSERVRIADGARSFGSRLALSPNGKLIAMTQGFDDFENLISLWDATSGERLGTLTGHKQGIWSIAFSPDGKTLASSSGGGTLRLWNVESRRELLTIRDPRSNLNDLHFSPDGQHLVSGSPGFALEGELRIFRAPSKGVSTP